MKRITLRALQGDGERYLEESQHEAIVITRRGRPAGVLLGVQGHDWETLERETDPAFWRMLMERRQQPTTPFWRPHNAGHPREPTSQTPASELMKRLGTLFARARARRRLTLKAVSQQVGSETYYGMIERGQRRPGARTLKELFDILDMSPEERAEAERLLEESILAASRERARARSSRAGLVAESHVRYGEARRSSGEDGRHDRLDRVEADLRRLTDDLRRLTDMVSVVVRAVPRRTTGRGSTGSAEPR